jgi:hypothetical protein
LDARSRPRFVVGKGRRRERTPASAAEKLMRISYELRPDHLRVYADGPFDAREARRGLGDVLRECQARGITRVFVDGRGIATTVSIADRYDIATQLATYGDTRMRMAILVSTANMFTKTLEDTASNRGLSLRTTDSLQEVLDYLGIAA